MKKWVYLFTALLCAGSFFFMLHVKTDVQRLVSNKKILFSEQQEMLEDLRILEAKYAHLARPSRLMKLGEELRLKEMKPVQIMDAYAWGVIPDEPF